MKTHAIVQARVGSARLPRKVFEKILGKTMLWHVVNRLRFVKKLDGVMLAIPDTAENDALEEFCQQEGVPCYRGSENNVLARYYGAAKAFETDTIVRITSDCPCIDPVLVDMLVERYYDLKADYIELDVERNFPRGVDAEVFSFRALEKAYLEARQPYEQEHVTSYIYEHPDLFSVHRVDASEELRRPDIRLTVDTKEDLEFVRAIYGELYNSSYPFSLQDITALCDSRPEILEINAGVQQKDYRV